MGGTKQVLATATNGQSRDLLESGPGQPCAFFLKDDADFFGNTGIWCIGYQIEQPAKNKSTSKIAKVRLLDWSEEDSPVNIQPLMKEKSLDDDFKSSAENGSSRYTCEALSVVENPKELVVGDLVYGQFQKGLLLIDVPSTTRIFYRGRVAGVDPTQNTCDICYDDGDYEMSVPFTNVVRVLVHHNETDWMNDIKIDRPGKSKTTGATASEATIKIDNERKVTYHYSVGDEQWLTKQSYKSALQSIFVDAKEKIDPARRLQWPTLINGSISPSCTPKRPPPLERNNEKRTKHSQSQSKKAKKTTAASGKAKTASQSKTTTTAESSMDIDTGDDAKSHTNDEYVTPAVVRIRRTAKSKAPVVYAEEDDEELDDDDEDAVMNDDVQEYNNGETANKMKPSTASGLLARRSQRSTTRKSRQTAMSRFVSDIPAVPEAATLLQLEELEPLSNPALRLAPMSRSEASTFEKVWGHEPFAGQELLYMNLFGRGRIPSKEFWVELIKLVAFGPKHNDVFFPDPYRMELTTNYILTLFRTKGTLQECCDSLMSTEYFNDNALGDVMLQQMGQDYYMARDDLDRDTSTERIHKTVHAKCCSARVLLEIVRYLLHQSVVDDVEPASVGGFFHQTPKECFRQAILVAESIWKLASRSGGTVEFVQLAESWGYILSYLAWWYGKVIGEDANALADLLCNIQMSVEDNSVLFDVIDTLRPEIIPQVRPKLAERWGLAEVYNLCYDIN